MCLQGTSLVYWIRSVANGHKELALLASAASLMMLVIYVLMVKGSVYRYCCILRDILVAAQSRCCRFCIMLKGDTLWRRKLYKLSKPSTCHFETCVKFTCFRFTLRRDHLLSIHTGNVRDVWITNCIGKECSLCRGHLFRLMIMESSGM